MATWTEDIVSALTKIGWCGNPVRYLCWSEKNKNGRVPTAIEATIRGAIERSSSDSKAHSGKNDIFFSVKGLGAGIWGLRSFATASPLANDVNDLPSGTPEPVRQAQVTYRILRESEMARKIKLLHKNTCQLCGLLLKVADRDYSEAHHFMPLGSPHFGPDVPGNIIVACPNCHVRLDYFSVHINPAILKNVGGHTVAVEYIDYHNQRVLDGPQHKP